eukprot:9242976-Karenia_brevis.AAC.1
MIAHGWSSFNSLLGAAYCHGLPMLLMASTIPNRVESTCLYGMGFCIIVKGVEHQLYRMQAGWAKALLGIRDCAEG